MKINKKLSRGFSSGRAETLTNFSNWPYMHLLRIVIIYNCVFGVNTEICMIFYHIIRGILDLEEKS